MVVINVSALWSVDVEYIDRIGIMLDQSVTERVIFSTGEAIDFERNQSGANRRCIHGFGSESGGLPNTQFSIEPSD
jgi:hypothetical protein